MYLMPLYSAMVEHGDVFGTAIGINMHSTDVDEFVESLLNFSKNLMEGDYGDYDTSNPTDIGLMSNSVVYNVTTELGYNPYAQKMTKGIVSDNTYPTVVLEGTVFTAPGLQPSGKFGTAEENSLRGLIMLVYFFIQTCTIHGEGLDLHKTSKFDCDHFFEYVLPRIYGDDLLNAVKDTLAPYFNNCTYQIFCKEIYGIRYTNAQKTAEMKPFLNIDEASFLKRTFVYRKDLGHWVAPLDKESIMKSICYVLPSKSVTLEEQLIDSCTSALRELFFHLDIEQYAITRANFACQCAKMFRRNQEDIFHVFPRFDEIEKSLYDPMVLAAP